MKKNLRLREEAEAVTYGYYALAGSDFRAEVWEALKRTGNGAVCDLGGGANPLIPLDVLGAQGLEYTVLDISEAELQKADGGYTKVVADVTAPIGSELEGRFDVVFSKMLAEHLRDGVRFHRNVFEMLRPGGIAIHLYPTLYALPFLVNRFASERLAYQILQRVAPRDSWKESKFPAYYDCCRGPSPRAQRLLHGLGYRVRKYKGYYGHGYFNRLPLLRRASDLAAHALMRHPLNAFTSYALVVLERPRSVENS